MRLLCEAVNSVTRDQRANLDAALSGTFSKKTENGTDLYTPRMIQFQIPRADGRSQTARVPLAALAAPRAMRVDKITFSVECGLSVKSGELMVGKPHKCNLFRKSVNARVEFTLAEGGTPRELETLIADYEASLRESVEK